ncbi:hypothetical protein J2X01_002700 [Arthrobacter ginsengisoli]|uniref:Uncharacterized protein n=1 Tax=Arthrobacter ginsengisoli TaxID=1356565 RepID=A0ABU1UE01_9MICC|nr:hypothetical protein [Arthrobacter ginsengisoli]
MENKPCTPRLLAGQMAIDDVLKEQYDLTPQLPLSWAAFETPPPSLRSDTPNSRTDTSKGPRRSAGKHRRCKKLATNVGRGLGPRATVEADWSFTSFTGFTQFHPGGLVRNPFKPTAGATPPVHAPGLVVTEVCHYRSL